MAGTDSAGVPWEGRHFEPNPSADDDGSAPPRLIEAIRRFRAREVGEAEVVEALRESRLLIPLVAELGDSGVTEHGHLVDKSQELSIVRVLGPDGRTVQPAFTSVSAMGAWNALARPIPAAAPRVALAAASEGTDVVVLDPTGPTEFAVRRPALWAIARSEAWVPCYLDERVLEEFLRAAEPELAVRAVTLAPGDPDARLAGPELVVRLALEEGLDRSSLDSLLLRLRERWSSSEIIADRVDTMKVQLVGAA
ncbi:SseB family protein [Salinibacterium soli]|uniref:SseB family protein n=1 Tax=Antiquaquibacter soli TaxID=3064523 RepID=A0ABT9BL39_9MICO|nr:SseB family protein [Protaetiibacter sp. WY-16]MDO7881731.1 SseB family protein [Protaetiibacter sp. WY-16]